MSSSAAAGNMAQRGTHKRLSQTVAPSSPVVESKPMDIRIFNTLSKTKEPLETVEPGKVGIYLCGPTVYKPSHIGHMVGPVIFDAVKRYLVYCGYDVTLVINVTDVDDKLIAESANRGMTMAELATEMTADYMRNLEAMGIDTINHFPRATENMDEIIAFTQELIDRGYAYAADGDVYFDVGKDTEYGKLSHRSIEALQGEGGEMAGRKRAPADFALWKGAKAGEPSWDSPWGPGRPGWHIECSAMSRRLLGKSFDIHGGGLDLIFPHHENEIAQSECCHGQPQARYWMHNGLMQAADEVGKVGGRNTRTSENEADAEAMSAGKISKSKGASAFRDLLQEFSAETIRFFLLSTHYRRPIYYSQDQLRAIESSLEAFYRFFKRFERVSGTSFYELDAPTTRRSGNEHIQTALAATGDDADLKSVADLRERFISSMDDDINTGGAIGDLFELVRSLNKFIDTAKLETSGAGSDKVQILRHGAMVLRELAGTLGLFRTPVETVDAAASDSLVGPLMQLLVDLRGQARKDKNFALADTIRNRLTELEIVLEDRPTGTEWTLPR